VSPFEAIAQAGWFVGDAFAERRSLRLPSQGWGSHPPAAGCTL